MTDHQVPHSFPKDAIFVRWGRFQAGLIGRPAILTMLGIVIAAVLLRLFNLI